MLTKEHIIAYSDLTLSMIFLGFTLVIGKSLITSFPILLLLPIRFLIGTIYFVGFLVLTNSQMSSLINELSKRDWLFLFLQSLLGAFAFNLFMLFGLHYTNVNIAAIITSTIPAFITIFSFILLREKISKNKFIAIIFSILGLVLVTVNAKRISLNETSLMGNFLVLMAVITGALFPICAKLLSSKVSTKLISLTFNLFGLMLFLPLTLNDAIQFNFSLISASAWLLIIFYSIAANVLYLSFWNKGLAIVSASTASLFTAIMPVSTAIMAYIFLHERLNVVQAIGMLCIFGAIFLGICRS